MLDVSIYYVTPCLSIIPAFRILVSLMANKKYPDHKYVICSRSEQQSGGVLSEGAWNHIPGDLLQWLLNPVTHSARF